MVTVLAPAAALRKLGFSATAKILTFSARLPRSLRRVRHGQRAPSNASSNINFATLLLDPIVAMGHNHSFVAMSPLPQSRSSVESIEQETRINGTMTTEAPQQSEMSLQEENERLRNQLAATQEQLRLLQAKNNELEPLKNGESTKRRHRKRWNWIQREEHELVPQEESSSLEIISTPRDTAEVTSTSMDSGLHRRHLEHPASPTLEENDTDTPLNTPFAIKAKMSDLELEKMEKGKHSPNRSDASDESFLNEYSIEEECVANIEDESFFRGMIDRSGWLVGLLILQSCSSFILSHNQGLLEEHIVIVQFLTMLVGAGGNAGNQASVRGKKNEIMQCARTSSYSTPC